MSIASFLLNKENISFVGSHSFSRGKPVIVEQGLRYFDSHDDEREEIVNNMRFMGLNTSASAVEAVLRGISEHYYEKLFILTKKYEAVWMAKNRVETDKDAIDRLHNALASGRSVFLAQSHFGASYLMGITLMSRGFDIHMVGKFPEPVGSMIGDGARLISERYGIGKTFLINIADDKTDVPHEMFKVLLGGQMLSNVFDENNEFCQEVTLLGKTIMGGSGMAQLLKNFTDDRLLVATPFMVRTGDDTFRFELDFHSLSSDDIIADFFQSLEKRISCCPEQWYFLREVHESIPVQYD